MYTTFAESTDIPELLQITGRLCTTTFDGVPLTLHITPRDHENLLKGFNITEEFVNRAAKLNEKNASVKEYISNLGMFKNKVPDSERSLTKFTKFRPKKVRTLEEDVKNGGWMTDEKGRYIVRIVKNIGNQINTLSTITKDGPVFGTIVEGVDHPEPDDYDVIEKKKVKKVEEKEEKEEKEKHEEEEKFIDGVDLIKLRDWFRENNNLLVSRMIKFLYKQEKPITIEEFKIGINYTGKDINSNIFNGRAIKSKYGLLWNVNKDVVNLNLKIRKFLCKLN